MMRTSWKANWSLNRMAEVKCSYVIPSTSEEEEEAENEENTKTDATAGECRDERLALVNLLENRSA